MDSSTEASEEKLEQLEIHITAGAPIDVTNDPITDDVGSDKPALVATTSLSGGKSPRSTELMTPKSKKSTYAKGSVDIFQKLDIPFSLSPDKKTRTLHTVYIECISLYSDDFHQHTVHAGNESQLKNLCDGIIADTQKLFAHQQLEPLEDDYWSLMRRERCRSLICILIPLLLIGGIAAAWFVVVSSIKSPFNYGIIGVSVVLPLICCVYSCMRHICNNKLYDDGTFEVLKQHRIKAFELMRDYQAEFWSKVSNEFSVEIVEFGAGATSKDALIHVPRKRADGSKYKEMMYVDGYVRITQEQKVIEQFKQELQQAENEEIIQEIL